MPDQPLPPAVLQSLRTLNAPTVANAIETFDVRPRNVGFMWSEVRCVFPEMPPMVGYAATAKIRSTLQPEPGQARPRREMWEHILSLPEPRIVVIEDVDERPLGSFWGEVQANIHRALGCIGTITNGGVRDLDEVRALGFHLFAGQVHVSHAYVHIVEVGVPVEIAGLRVRPGDLLHGDQHGVIQVPHEIAPEIYAAAKRVEEREQRIIQFCQSPGFNVDGLTDVYQ